MANTTRTDYDVVILGAGLAGLTLARHLTLYTKKRVLLLDNRLNPPRESPQKYGESLVQCSGYYFSKVLDLEEHLLTRHYLKYNLRFYWPTEGLANQAFEDYGQSFGRQLSNVATFQLDRNLFEEHLLDINKGHPRCEFLGGVKRLEVQLAEHDGLHRITFEGGEVLARWVVDASGRGAVLKRKLGLKQQNPIRHGATFFWVEGLVNIERLTNREHQEVLRDRQRSRNGHFPFFLATNHFCAEGQWFWVIPLHGKTSLGLVYDRNVVRCEDVITPEKVIEHVCRIWPLFARDLPNRKILDEGRLFDYSYDCRQTISPQRWALVGEAGRFSDPLYSPGSDLISIYNILIVNAIESQPHDLLAKCRSAEMIERVMYESYVPSYAVSYDCLGDQEAFSLKYSWELAVYFGFYVFPMVNNLFTNQQFVPGFLRRFAALGRINANLQRFLSAFFQWKKRQPPVSSQPLLVEFYEMGPLREAEQMFYRLPEHPQDALESLDGLMEHLYEFARYILTHVHASVLGDPEVLTNAPFIDSLDLKNITFDPVRMGAEYARYSGDVKEYAWNLNPWVMGTFINPRATVHSQGLPVMNGRRPAPPDAVTPIQPSPGVPSSVG